MYRFKVRKGIEEQSNVWLEYIVLEEKGVGDVSKYWILKVLYDVKIYFENNGELLKSFKEGSYMIRFIVQKDFWL